jgi:hypothetical protein
MRTEIRITDDVSRQLKAAFASDRFSMVCRRRKSKGLSPRGLAPHPQEIPEAAEPESR